MCCFVTWNWFMVVNTNGPSATTTITSLPHKFIDNQVLLESFAFFCHQFRYLHCHDRERLESLTRHERTHDYWSEPQWVAQQFAQNWFVTQHPNGSKIKHVDRDQHLICSNVSLRSNDFFDVFTSSGDSSFFWTYWVSFSNTWNFDFLIFFQLMCHLFQDNISIPLFNI